METNKRHWQYVINKMLKAGLRDSNPDAWNMLVKEIEADLGGNPKLIGFHAYEPNERIQISLSL